MKLRDGTVAAFRVVHLDNLELYLRREALHAANATPPDGLTWRDTHLTQVQTRRATTPVPAGPGGVLLDYVPFHLGPRNLFLFNLKTGRVPGYDEGQEPLVTLVVSVQQVCAAGIPVVFYDGHPLQALSRCYDDLADLDELDWAAIEGRQLSGTENDATSQLCCDKMRSEGIATGAKPRIRQRRPGPQEAEASRAAGPPNPSLGTGARDRGMQCSGSRSRRSPPVAPPAIPS